MEALSNLQSTMHYRSKYNDEFKERVAKTLIDNKWTLKKTVAEFNVSAPTVAEWVRRYKKYGKIFSYPRGKQSINYRDRINHSTPDTPWVDPRIQILIDSLPKSAEWPVQERVNWLKLASLMFNTMYATVEEIEIGVK